MSKPVAAAAPASGTSDGPTFEDLVADPEINALLDFEPAPRKMPRPDGWLPVLQRELIARMAHCGSPGVAAEQMGKNASGAKRLYQTPEADSFRAAWQAALALAQERARAGRAAAYVPPMDVPGMTRRPGRKAAPAPLLPGQVYNENGYPEDEASFVRRGREAQDSVADKLLRCRRAYLAEISRNPGKRAAFEILTELPIDWDKARRQEPQDHEPYRAPRMVEPDMVLTAENGWMNSIVRYGPDKLAGLRAAIDRHRAEQGLPPASWDEEMEEEVPGGGGWPNPVPPADRHPGFARRSGFSRPSADAPGEDGSAPDDAAPARPGTPRSMSLNSPEFYKAATEPYHGELPRAPREWDPEPVPKIGPAPRKGRRK